MINDLLPLYTDEVLSPDSKTAVSEHLQTCEKCRRTSIEMNVALPESTALTDNENPFFKALQKKIRKLSITRTLLVLLLVFIVWLCANAYLILHYQPVISNPHPESVKECLEIVQIGEEYYLHQTDFFGQGEIVLLHCENGEVNFYLGENGLHSLGFARSWIITPQYQRLIDPRIMSEVKTVNYCNPDGTVIVTLWKTGEKIIQLNK